MGETKKGAARCDAFLSTAASACMERYGMAIEEKGSLINNAFKATHSLPSGMDKAHIHRRRPPTAGVRVACIGFASLPSLRRINLFALCPTAELLRVFYRHSSGEYV